jgi:hypothetical protein
MIAPNDETLLDVWEEHLGSHPVRRAIGVLAAAVPDRGWDGWARAPIGERDHALLGLHERLFGSDLHTTASCPQCGERLESDFTAAQIRSGESTVASTLQLHEGGFAIECRLPTSEDLLYVAAERQNARHDAAGDVAVLLRRCVSSAHQDDRSIDPSSLPADVVNAVANAMSTRDPGADVRITLECPACSHIWELHFDIVSYFWSELDDWAQRTLADVHALATAYGWTEHTVLALSPARRRIYLDMVGA